jgi:hypothetical protein
MKTPQLPPLAGMTPLGVNPHTGETEQQKETRIAAARKLQTHGTIELNEALKQYDSLTSEATNDKPA